MKNRIVINGVAIEVEGSNVSVYNGTLYIDDRPVASDLSGQVHIYWYGDLARLQANGPVTCHGNVYGKVSANGPLHCQELKGSANANGPTRAASIYGNINANGPVNIR